MEDNIGRGMATWDKEDGFGKYIDLHCKIVKHVFDRPRPYPFLKKYTYIDTNAGSGDNGPHGPGSPYLALLALDKYGLDYDAHFLELEAGNVERLKTLATSEKIKVHEGDNAETIKAIIPTINRKSYGLAYMDPNGCPDIDILGYIADNRPYIDLMIRVNGTAMKRTRTAFDGKPSFVDIMRRAKKEKWIIREPLPNDRWQWVFLFGTNYSEWGAWKCERFYGVESKEGQAILERLNYTATEIEAMRQPLLDMRQSINERSNGMCEVCRIRPATEIHHWRYGPGHDPNKAINICHECHCKIERKAI